jgi:hypothetical protein
MLREEKRKTRLSDLPSLILKKGRTTTKRREESRHSSSSKDN